VRGRAERIREGARIISQRARLEGVVSRLASRLKVNNVDNTVSCGAAKLLLAITLFFVFPPSAELFADGGSEAVVEPSSYGEEDKRYR